MSEKDINPLSLSDEKREKIVKQNIDSINEKIENKIINESTLVFCIGLIITNINLIKDKNIKEQCINKFAKIKENENISKDILDLIESELEEISVKENKKIKKNLQRHSIDAKTLYSINKAENCIETDNHLKKVIVFG